MIKEKGTVRLTEAAVSRWKRPADVTPEDFAAVALERVVTRGRGVRPIGSSAGVDDFVQAIAFLFAADDALRGFDRFEVAKGAKAAKSRTFADYQIAETGSQILTDWPVGNEVRWPPFIRWTTYLGLGRTVGGALTPEASTALTSRLKGRPQGQHQVMDFLEWCADALPFLDGGEHCHFPPQREGDNVVLSPGLSATLWQMESNGALKMSRLSDDRNATLRLRADQTGDRSVSTVEWFGRALTRKASR